MRKQIFIILTTAILVVAFFVLVLLRERWLTPLTLLYPWLAGLAAYLNKHSAAIQAFGVIVGGIFCLTRLFANRDSKTALKLISDVLEPIDTETQRSNLGRYGGKISWVDREIINFNEFRKYKKIAFIGPMKSGKTREAIELIEISFLSDIIINGMAFSLNISLGEIDKINIDHIIASLPKKSKNILFFLDDIPQNYPIESLNLITEILHRIESISLKPYIIVTVRSDLMSSEHEEWLVANNIRTVNMLPLNKEQSIKLINNVMSIFKIEAEQEVIEVLVSHGDGTPEQLISVFRQINISKIKKLTIGLANIYARNEAEVIWHDTRDYIYKNNSVAGDLIDIIALFKTCRMKPYARLIVAMFTIEAISHNSIFSLFTLKKKALNALDYLSKFDIVTGNKFIIMPDPAVPKYDILKAIGALISLLNKHGKTRYQLLLKYVFNALDEYDLTATSLDKMDYEKEINNSIKNRIILRNQAMLENVARSLEKIIVDNLLNLEYQVSLIQPQKNQLTLSREEQQFLQECSSGFWRIEHESYSDAADHFESVTINNPDNYYAHYHLSLLHFWWGQTDEAKLHCHRAIQINPNYDVALSLLGALHLHCGDLDMAETFFQKALKINPLYPGSIQGLASIYMQRSQQEEALTFLRNNIRPIRAHKCLVAFAECIQLAIKSSKLTLEEIGDQSMQLLRAYLPDITYNTLNAPLAEIKLRISEAKAFSYWLYRNCVSPKNEIAEAEDAIENFDILDFMCLIVIINIMEGNLDNAIKLLTKLAESDYYYKESSYFLGTVYLLNNSSELAIIAFQNVLGEEQGDIDIQLQLARAYLANNMLDEAAEILFSVLEIEPFHAEARLLRAVCYKRLKNLEKFRSEIEFVKVSKSLSSIDTARLNAISGDFDNALNLIQKELNDNFIMVLSIISDPCFEDLSTKDGFKKILNDHDFILMTNDQNTND